MTHLIVQIVQIRLWKAACWGFAVSRVTREHWFVVHLHPAGDDDDVDDVVGDDDGVEDVGGDDDNVDGVGGDGYNDDDSPSSSIMMKMVSLIMIVVLSG